MIAMLLNDRETYTDIDGCQILDVDTDLLDEYGDLDALLSDKPEAVRVIGTFTCDEGGFWKIIYNTDADNPQEV